MDIRSARFIIMLILMSWHDSVQRIQRVEKQWRVLQQHLVNQPQSTHALSERVKRIADDPNRKIEAIKAFRDETGFGLAGDKEPVEEYQRNKRDIKKICEMIILFLFHELVTADKSLTYCPVDADEAFGYTAGYCHSQVHH